MKTLIAILWSMLLLSAVHAQTSDGFPKLPQVPHTKELSDDPTSTKFTFIAAGDNRPGGKSNAQPPTLAYIMKHSQRHNPVFIIWAGDTILGHRIAGQPMHHKRLMKQYNDFFQIVKRAGVPVFNSPGNHEMDRVDHTTQNGKKGTIEIPDKKMESLYLEMYKYPSGAPPYGAFNYGNSRFIAVDTEEVATGLTLTSGGKTVGKGLKLDPGYVSQQQIDALTADLNAHQDKDYIFVFMHHPIMPARNGSRLNEENADKLQQLFAQYKNVSYVIAAHEHIYFNATGKTLQPKPRASRAPGGPAYLVTGGAGAPLDKCPKPTPKNCAQAYHYLVFKVDGPQLTVDVVMVPVKLSQPKTKR